MSHTVLTAYYRPKPGGFCRRYFRAIRALCERGHTVHALSVVRFPIEHENFRWHRFPWPSRWTDNYLFWMVFHLLAPWMLLAIAVRHRVDRLFAFSPTYALMLQPTRRWKRARLAVFLRADSIENHALLGRPDWLIGLETWLERIGLKGAHVFAVSHALARAIVRRHPHVDAGVLPNDVPVAVAERDRGHGNSCPRLACVGVLEPRKQQSLVLFALAGLRSLDWQLDIFGDGIDHGMLEQCVADLGIGDRVTFHGWVPAEIVWGTTDLLLFPSKHEGAPNAVLEAMAHDIPVLASAIPEHREVLPEASLLPVNDVGAWTARLERFLESPTADSAHLLADQRVFRDALSFDWEAKAAQLIIEPAETP